MHLGFAFPLLSTISPSKPSEALTIGSMQKGAYYQPPSRPVPASSHRSLLCMHNLYQVSAGHV